MRLSEFAGLRLCFAVLLSVFVLEAGLRDHALAQQAIVAAAWPGGTCQCV